MLPGSGLEPEALVGPALLPRGQGLLPRCDAAEVSQVGAASERETLALIEWPHAHFASITVPRNSPRIMGEEADQTGPAPSLPSLSFRIPDGVAEPS